MIVIGNRAGPLARRLVQLFAGLVLYGVSMALMIDADLGLDPWDVLHQGLSRVTGISFGLVVIGLGIPILLLWIPLRQRPGFGTLANLVVIGFAVDGALDLLPAVHGLPLRAAYLAGGVLLNGIATGLYIGSRLGPGPRDGLMTGLHRRFPKLSLRLVRGCIELSVLTAGFLLGGTVGVGTVVYALAIGPLVHVFIPLFTIAPPAERDRLGRQSGEPRGHRAGDAARGRMHSVSGDPIRCVDAGWPPRYRAAEGPARPSPKPKSRYGTVPCSA